MDILELLDGSARGEMQALSLQVGQVHPLCGRSAAFTYMWLLLSLQDKRALSSSSRKLSFDEENMIMWRNVKKMFCKVGKELNKSEKKRRKNIRSIADDETGHLIITIDAIFPCVPQHFKGLGAATYADLELHTREPRIRIGILESLFDLFSQLKADLVDENIF